MPLLFLAASVVLASGCSRVSFPGGSWDARSAAFKWWAGEIKLPAGFTYHPGGGGDSFTGRFTSPDGKLFVDHDIGACYISGAFASKEGSLVFNERIVDGARVWTAKKDQPLPGGQHTLLVVVTFPDRVCANFYLTSSNPEDAAVIDFVARSFRPSRM
jgi:hypothetical protein